MIRGKVDRPEGAGKVASLLALIAVLCLLSSPVLAAPAGVDASLTGPRIMEEVYRRHVASPYVYEEQTVILTDRAGNRNVRKARRYSRVEEDGSARFLIVFDTPPEVRGVALLAVGRLSGPWEWKLYLPALGRNLISYEDMAGGSRFLGTDFTVMDLTAEVLSDFQYVRKEDRKISLVPCYVVDALPRDRDVEQATGYGLRRHFLRKDNFSILRTDYFDRQGRFFKRRTFHDLKRVDGDTWDADMILMENAREKHMTMIKIDRRVLSGDYVPPEIFARSWLLENRHIQVSKRHLFEENFSSAPTSGQGPEAPGAGDTGSERR